MYSYTPGKILQFGKPAAADKLQTTFFKPSGPILIKIVVSGY
jgi:hypothetical protein